MVSESEVTELKTLSFEFSFSCGNVQSRTEYSCRGAVHSEHAETAGGETLGLPNFRKGLPQLVVNDSRGIRRCSTCGHVEETELESREDSTCSKEDEAKHDDLEGV